MSGVKNVGLGKFWMLGAALLAVMAIVFVMVMPHSKAPDAINAATDVRLDQKLKSQVTLSTLVRNEDDKTVPLATYFGGKPVILIMPFYKCPGTCTAELSGMVALLQDMKRYKVGRDFQVITLSISPTEHGDLATMKKKAYLSELGQPGAETGWHFLTAQESSIQKIADEIGFRYKYVPASGQYAHPTGIMVLTPQGKVSSYFYGLGYPPADVTLALTEAGQGQIGSLTDQIMLGCYNYDPAKGKYGPAVFRLVQIAGMATVLILGSFMLLSFRQDKQRADGLPTTTGVASDISESQRR